MTKGVSKATIKEIAAEAEVSPGTLYIYFKNKEELYTSLTIRMLKHLHLRLQRLREVGGYSRARKISAVKEALCEAYDTDPPVFIALLRLLASETLDNISSELLEQIVGLSRRCIDALAAVLTQAAGPDDLVRRNPHRAALILLSLFSGLVLWEESKRALDPKKDFLQPTLDLAFELFSRGFDS